MQPSARLCCGCKEQIDLAQALASERLKTDGAEVLSDFGKQSSDPADQDMAEGPVIAAAASTCSGRWPAVT